MSYRCLNGSCFLNNKPWNYRALETILHYISINLKFLVHLPSKPVTFVFNRFWKDNESESVWFPWSTCCFTFNRSQPLLVLLFAVVYKLSDKIRQSKVPLKTSYVPPYREVLAAAFHSDDHDIFGWLSGNQEVANRIWMIALRISYSLFT